MEKITSGFGDWSVRDLALIAAEACYKPNDNDAERLAMQIVIENLVLDNDVAGYTIQDLAEAIVCRLTTRPPDPPAAEGERRENCQP